MTGKQAAVITGGAGGIGKELVAAYAKKGYDVLFADVLEEQGRQLERGLSASGLRVQFVPADLAKEEDVKHLMEEAVKNGRTLSVLINNAGKSVWKSPYHLTSEEWDDVLNANLKSVFLCSREAAKKNEGKRKRGRHCQHVFDESFYV